MARKRDPNAVVDTFTGELAGAKDDWEALRDEVGQSGRLAQRGSMDALTRYAVAFERFRSDWHIAAITQDATRFRETQRNRVVEALAESNRQQLAQWLPALTIPKHPTLPQVEELLDASGSNLAIPSIVKWQQLANRHLRDPWKAEVDGISVAHARAWDAVVAIRNAAAHQSPQSRRSLDWALQRLTLPDHQGLRRPTKGVDVSGLANFLNGDTGAGVPRVDRFRALLRALAESLRV